MLRKDEIFDLISYDWDYHLGKHGGCTDVHS